MPNITLNFTAEMRDRILAWLDYTKAYPATQAGYKQALADWTDSMVREAEDAKAREDALAALQPAPALEVS